MTQFVRTAHGVKDKGGGKRSGGSGALGAAEAADIAAILGEPIISSSTQDAIGAFALGEVEDARWGALAATEAADVFAASGAIVTPVLGTLAAAELPDTAVVSGLVADAGAVAGVLAATEGADAAAFSGEAAGEVAPPIFIGGGAYLPPRPYPVEGIGYGVLPGLWGEAHGTIGTALGEPFPSDDDILMLLLLAA